MINPGVENRASTDELKRDIHAARNRAYKARIEYEKALAYLTRMQIALELTEVREASEKTPATVTPSMEKPVEKPKRDPLPFEESDPDDGITRYHYAHYNTKFKPRPGYSQNREDYNA